MSEAYHIKIQGQDYHIREDMVEALEAYANKGRPLGDFLKAVVSNNLTEACLRADYQNLANIQAYAHYLYWVMPSKAWHSEQAYYDWLKKFVEVKTL